MPLRNEHPVPATRSFPAMVVHDRDGQAGPLAERSPSAGERAWRERVRLAAAELIEAGASDPGGAP